jgi:hypothetical protein
MTITLARALFIRQSTLRSVFLGTADTPSRDVGAAAPTPETPSERDEAPRPGNATAAARAEDVT